MPMSAGPKTYSHGGTIGASRNGLVGARCPPISQASASTNTVVMLIQLLRSQAPIDIASSRRGRAARSGKTKMAQHGLCDRQRLRLGSHLLVARLGQPDRKIVDNAATVENDDTLGQDQRFLDVVRNEDDRPPGSRP